MDAFFGAPTEHPLRLLASVHAPQHKTSAEDTHGPGMTAVPHALASLFDEDAEFVHVIGVCWHDRESIRKARACLLHDRDHRSRTHLSLDKTGRFLDE